MPLSYEQLRVLEIVERCASGLSILGIATIIIAFSVSPHFRNPINRLILINAFYNIFDATLTMISLDGPRAGDLSALCQFQAFLNQMFPLADVFWTLAMAIDVYLIVFRRYEHSDLRKLEIWYIGAITAFCFIPSLVLLFINTPEKGPMYGSVKLWCAIAPNWVLFRIVIYYVPIWSSIFVTMVLYILVGLEILKRRKDLKSIGSDTIPLDNVVVMDTSHFNNAGDVDFGAQSQTTTQDGKDSVASKSSISTPRTRPSGHMALDQGPADRSSLSFRQYVVMPAMFFVVLMAIWVAPTTNRIAAFVQPGFESFPLLVAVGAMGSLRGFWNGVVFIIIGMKGRKRQKSFERKPSTWRTRRY